MKMLIYASGDSHTAGAEAVNPHAFAEDHYLYKHLGRAPHPDNLKVSYGQLLADMCSADLICDAESAGSIPMILRKIKLYLADEKPRPDLVVIGWPTFEREEWLHEGIYYQITASGSDQVPYPLRNRYKEWVIEQSDPAIINSKLVKRHDDIYDMHGLLRHRGINHIFFNTYSHFAHIKNLHHLQAFEYDWQSCYLDPYDAGMTYYNWLIQNGYKTVRPESYHFGADAHRAWANLLFKKLVEKGLTQNE